MAYQLLCHYAPDALLIVKETMLHHLRRKPKRELLENIDLILSHSTTLTEITAWQQLESINPEVEERGARVSKEFEASKAKAKTGWAVYQKRMRKLHRRVAKRGSLWERILEGDIGPPPVKVFDGFLFDKVVEELLAEGYTKVAVGTYVKGDQRVQTCQHKYDQSKFCVVTTSSSTRPKHRQPEPS